MGYEQHRAAQKYQHHRETYCSSMFTATEQQKACIEEKQDATEYLPWGYKLFIWPEGITAWAIILTGFAIAWQAIETRKAAIATADAARSTRDSVRIAQSKDRGRIRIELLQPKITPLVVPSLQGMTLYHLQLKLILEGGSEATIIESKELGRICSKGVQPSSAKLIQSTWPRVVNPKQIPLNLSPPY